MAKYQSKSRFERDQSRVIDTPIPMVVTVGSVIDVISQNGKGTGNIIVAIKNDDGTFKNETALPASPHFISLPLPNERVTCFKDSNTSKWYYLSPITNNGLVNHMSNGVKRIFKQDTSDLYTGKSFIPSPSLRSLNIHEGDTIFQGRNGQSIRLGSNSRAIRTPWNTASEEGLPIITLRTGVSQIENLDVDFSSIYITSGQTIPVVLNSNIPASYTKPNIFDQNQIILTSDRITLYTKNDNIILSSFKDISLSTDKWALDITTLADQLSTLCDLLVKLSDKVALQGLYSATSTHVSSPSGGPTSTSINAPQFQQISTESNTLKSQLQQIKNKLDNMKQ